MTIGITAPTCAHRITIEFGKFEDEDMSGENKMIFHADDLCLLMTKSHNHGLATFSSYQDQSPANGLGFLVWISHIIIFAQQLEMSAMERGVFDVMGEYVMFHLRKIMKYIDNKPENRNNKPSNPDDFGFSQN
jgi:hypothetical protein